MVTKQGNQFAARVASSLLNSLDLQELITKNNNEYENRDDDRDVEINRGFAHEFVQTGNDYDMLRL